MTDEPYEDEALLDGGSHSGRLRKYRRQWRRPSVSDDDDARRDILARARKDALELLDVEQAPREQDAFLEVLDDDYPPPDDAETRRRYADALGVPRIVRAASVVEPQPPSVLERPGQGIVLPRGEVAVLAGSGGAGKSYVSLDLAFACASAHVAGAPKRVAACGLECAAGPVLVVSYEDRASTVKARLDLVAAASNTTLPDPIHLWIDPEPLMAGDPERRGMLRRYRFWDYLWRTARELGVVLVILDPASMSLVDVSASESFQVRKFLGGIAAEARKGDFGVLVVAHDTKQARMGINDSGVISGSSQWFDGVRGVLHMSSDPDDGLRIECAKANRGPKAWKIPLRERFTPSTKFAGYEEAVQQPTPASTHQARSSSGPAGRHVDFDAADDFIHR